MNFDFEIHWGAFLILPLLGIAEGRCECCDEVAGISIDVGWAFFSAHVVFTWGGGRHAS